MSNRDRASRERKEYSDEVFYQAWKRGVNINRINEDQVEKDFEAGYSPEHAVNRILRSNSNKEND